MYSIRAMAKLMTVMLIFSVVFISCTEATAPDTEPEGEPGVFSCSSDADCELTDLNAVTSPENCWCGGSGCLWAVNTEEAQRRQGAYEEYCSDDPDNCVNVDCIPPCWSGTEFTGDPKAKCVDNSCQMVCE